MVETPSVHVSSAAGNDRPVHTLSVCLLNAWCLGASILAVMVSGSVLIGGWSLGMDAVGAVLPGLATMKANTALCLFLLGGALALSRGLEPSRAVRRGVFAAATLVGLIAVATLVEDIGRVNAGIDELLFRDVASSAGQHPGRMSPFTALCLLMIAFGVLTLDRPRLFRSGQIAAVAAGFIAFLNVVAYIYSVHALAGALAPTAYTAMAIHTAITLVILSIGVTAARPGRGATGLFVQATTGGAVARALAPVAIVGPVALGAVTLAGQRVGYYATEFGLALLVVANAVVLTTVVWWIAVHLHRSDTRRRRAEAELRRTNEELEDRVRIRTAEIASSERRFRRLVEDSAQGMAILQGGVVRFGNLAGATMLGYPLGGLAGHPFETVLAPEYHADVRARLAARLRGEDVPATREVELLRSDGGRLWVETTASVVDWEGAPSTLIAVTDITDRRQRAIAEQSAAELRAVTALAQAAAHEINNPLAVIMGNVSLLPAEGAFAGRVTTILKAVDQVREIVMRLGRITKVEMHQGFSPDLAPMLDIRRSGESSKDAGAGL